MGRNLSRLTERLRALIKILLGEVILWLANLISAVNAVGKLFSRSNPNFLSKRTAKLIYKHIYLTHKRGKFVALEIDTIEPTEDRKTATVKWIVVSNSGILRHSSLVDLTTREIRYFDEKPLPDHYFVLWAGHKLQLDDRLMVYDRELQTKSMIKRRYGGRRIDCWVLETESTGPEEVRVLYDTRSLVEIEARSEKKNVEVGFSEVYSLIYDNVSI